MRNAIDKSLTERDANIDKFCTHLDKDIAELGKEVNEVKQEAQVCVIYIVLHRNLPTIFLRSTILRVEFRILVQMRDNKAL